MLSDPLSVTYDTVGYTLPRAFLLSDERISTSFVHVSNGLSVVTERSSSPFYYNKRVIMMVRKDYGDTDATNGISLRRWGNGVGLVFDTDVSGYESADIAKLRTAMLALFDTTVASRVVAGEG